MRNFPFHEIPENVQSVILIFKGEGVLTPVELTNIKSVKFRPIKDALEEVIGARSVVRANGQDFVMEVEFYER